ncbi:MAG TPA: signal peptidase I [Acidimicrobiales bacterium]|jgi:signal peptidase I|nr:signal peptidase I [Acidimicrobiales bacterium]
MTSPPVEGEEPRSIREPTPTLDVTTPTPPGKAPRPRFRVVAEWLAVALLAICGALVIRTWVVQTFSVPSSSMYPTLQIGDRILVDRIPGLAHSIHRGDVIVFHKVPADHDGKGPEDLVKRVIGLPGERISSVGDTIYINGTKIAQPWLHLDAVSPQGACRSPSPFDIPKSYSTTKLAPGHYFVMGDCRGISDDSRYWGTVPISAIIGRVFTVVWRSNHPWVHWL